MWRRGISAIFLAGALSACAVAPRGPDLGKLYNRSAQSHDELRNPVILIPGLMGSRLVDSRDDSVIWGSFAKGYADPETPEGARRFSVPMELGRPLSSLRDSVRTDGSLERIEVKILGLPLAVDAYTDILSALGIAGYRRRDSGSLEDVDYGADHFTCFQFDYDWRLSSADNARRLHEFILDRREWVRSEIEKRFGVVDHDVHFDIVAHSMGSLVARYYLRYGGAPLPESGPVTAPTWAGAEFVDRAILVAPPNAGAPQILVDLVGGKDFGFLLPNYSSALLGTLPSLYELLPRSRHGHVVDGEGEVIPDLLDIDLWTRNGWGLADPREDKMLKWLLPGARDAGERRAIALDHLVKALANARRFIAALDYPSPPPSHLQIDLIAGDAHDTPDRVQVVANKAHVIGFAAGDGTVLRSSALMDERLGARWQSELISPISWHHVTFLFSDHLDLTKDPAFTDNALYMLMEAPRSPR